MRRFLRVDNPCTPTLSLTIGQSDLACLSHGKRGEKTSPQKIPENPLKAPDRRRSPLRKLDVLARAVELILMMPKSCREPLWFVCSTSRSRPASV